MSAQTIGRPLPQFVRDLLSSPPKSGEDEGGVHRYMFRVARVLHPYRSEAEIIDTLRAAHRNMRAHCPGAGNSGSRQKLQSLCMETG